MKRISIGSLIILIYALLVFYFGFSTYKWIETWTSLVNPWLFGLVWFSLGFGFMIGRLGHFLRFFSVLGSYWFILMQYGLILYPLATIIYLIWPTEETVFLTGTVCAAIFLAIYIAGTYFAFSPVVRHKTITIDRDSGSRRELKVVLASDFHLGLLSNKKHLQRFVNLANGEKPDVVLLAGDLVDDDPIWFVREGMAEVMRQLKPSYGVYGVLGNHEYYGGKIPLLIDEMESAGVRMLLDETICVEDSLYITGREDTTNRSRKPLENLAPENRLLPWFVMDHTPLDLNTPAGLGVDLHVSGHTHRGQMWPNHLITRRIFELDYGYKLKGSMHAFVSSGFGFWGPPIRLGSRSELWSITVVFQSK